FSRKCRCSTARWTRSWNGCGRRRRSDRTADLLSRKLRGCDNPGLAGMLIADLIDADARANARIVCRERAVIAGIPWAQACFRALDADARIEWMCADGDRVEPESVLCHIEGKARALVGAERCALNFLQTLSATATATRAYVDAVVGTRATILDTRKTLPGLRIAQKYAVR